MAQRVITELVDDLDGTALTEGEGETITFSIDGTTRQIDLSDKNAGKFRKAMQPYLDAGRKVGGTNRRRASKPASDGAPDPKVIREWAIEQGIELSARGRIPSQVAEQYLSSR